MTDPDGGREWAAMGGCWGPDRKTFVTDPEEWAAMGGCWGPDRKTFVTDPEEWAAMGGCWGPDRKMFAPQSPKMHGKFSHN